MKISDKLIIAPVILSLFMLFIMKNYNPILPIIIVFFIVRKIDIAKGMKGVWLFVAMFFILMPYNLRYSSVLYFFCESYVVLPFFIALLISVEELFLCFIWKIIGNI